MADTQTQEVIPGKFEVLKNELLKQAGVEHYYRIDPAKQAVGVLGMAEVKNKTVYGPNVRSLKDLYTVAHECGHVWYGHGTKGYISRHMREYQACQFAITAFKHFGLEIPADSLESDRRYVALCCKGDLAMDENVTEIEPEVKEFIKGEVVTNFDLLFLIRQLMVAATPA